MHLIVHTLILSASVLNYLAYFVVAFLCRVSKLNNNNDINFSITRQHYSVITSYLSMLLSRLSYWIEM